MELSLESLIRNRAYELWNANGRLDGRAEEDWLTAEQEIMAGRKTPVAPLEVAGGIPASKQTALRRGRGRKKN